MNYQDFISPELLVLIPVLYLVGVGIKKSAIADKWIPLLLGAVSIILSAMWVFATTDISGTKDVVLAAFTAITQGVLIAGASVYANQIVKQVTKGD